MASGAEVLTSTEIYDWAHGRRRFGRRRSMPFGIYSRTLRTLRAMCEPVGRAPTIGRPWLWRLRNSHEEGALKPRRLGLANPKRPAAAGKGLARLAID
jgi:hypothetical protein